MSSYLININKHKSVCGTTETYQALGTESLCIKLCLQKLDFWCVGLGLLGPVFLVSDL